MNDVRIGMLSFAHLHASSYAACLNQLPEATLAGIWDDDPKRGEEMAQQFDSKFVASLDELLASDIAGVIICAENNKHRELVEKAAAAGKWILCEKPLSPNVEDAQAMIDACKKANVGLGTAFPCRFIPSLMEAREQIRAGEIGEVLAASCTNNGQNPGGWFVDESASGGGATMDHTVHVVDLLRWILDLEFTKVYCELGNQLHGDEMTTDDLGSLNLEMAGGVQISHIASWSRPKCFPIWGDVTIEFIGTEGVMMVDAFNQKLDVYDDEKMHHSYAGWGDNPDLGLVKDFVQSVAKREMPAVRGEDGLRATEVTVAAYKAAAAKEMVKV